MSILFKGNLEEGNYMLVKSTDGWVLKGETSYAGFDFIDRPQTCDTCKHNKDVWYGVMCGSCYDYSNYEPQVKRPCNNCQEFDCYGCEYKQTEREDE